ncbi:hypothetical protein [Mesorhizobium sp. CO1-1-8]|uniref:hypothetical protein n=1 Tax=Mesorhizobium sp. CO1-1-8 TaxID=2876631 RepID=UPI001CD072E5|nr:hypothetical protein [Mesorhizobium sp. CO1-1-8]MBZ9772621.1 hypothetical protein [Mesorhizobium sp. CO1-1-8]
MTDLGTYSFVPWIRHGLANQIATPDTDTSVKVRATIDIELDLVGDKPDGTALPLPVKQKIALYGPGDVVGVESRAVVRTEPRAGSTNFEPNYLAAIEFYDEDFPWRYSPIAPDAGRDRLRPWLALIVLAENEFKDARRPSAASADAIQLLDMAVLPRADDLWAWAHVHANRRLGAAGEIVATDAAAVQSRLTGVLAENADLAYSRILSPRQLSPNTGYQAFLMPTFEAGRRAALGIELGDVAAALSSWAPGAGPDPQLFPYYYRWSFRTGARGDFETLVRLLKPMPVDRRVGVREMDVLDPGPGIRPLDSPGIDGILKLGGALRPPMPKPAPGAPPPAPDLYEHWDAAFPVPLQVDLAAQANLPDTLIEAGDPDPTIAPPLYGTWHALTRRLATDPLEQHEEDKLDWVRRINLDPRFRAPAGFGTRIIQDQQERYMDAAWGQVGRILEAQRRIRLGQMAVAVSDVWFDHHLMPLLTVSPQQTLLLLAPLNKRIRSGEGVTLYHQQGESFLQPAMTSPALRRIIRPRGRLMRTLPATPAGLLDRAASGSINAAPPKVAPPGLYTKDDAAKDMLPKLPAWLIALARKSWLPWLLVAIAVLVIVLVLVVLAPTLALPIVALVIAVLLFLLRWLSRMKAAIAGSDALSTIDPGAVSNWPPAPGFQVGDPGASYTPGPGPDSTEAGRLKDAIRDTLELYTESEKVGRTAERRPFDLGGAAGAALKAIDPRLTIPGRISLGIFLPPRIRFEIGESFVEPMAYPVIDAPMYKPLTDRSPELFLPNINLIPNNSITLLETNQRFIESYMVGLNHEFARELLWREFPTDQRGSSFRQFWDVDGMLLPAGTDPEARRDKLRDIQPLHLWSRASKLGSHDNRERPGDDEEELVLVIRGELLKRYPNAVVYAHRACWQRHDDGTAADKAREPWLRHGPIDKTKERRLLPLSDVEEADPPRAKLRTPLYEAKVDPDIYFLGFDLTATDAKGPIAPAGDEDDPGWFFIIKERPGEPRFGLDTDKQPRLNVWSDLAWLDVQPDASAANLDLSVAPATLALVEPTGTDSEKAPQFADDAKVGWNRDAMSSAEFAYILFQSPVLVGVHASEMLPS